MYSDGTIGWLRFYMGDGSRRYVYEQDGYDWWIFFIFLFYFILFIYLFGIEEEGC